MVFFQVTKHAVPDRVGLGLRGSMIFEDLVDCLDVVRQFLAEVLALGFDGFENVERLVAPFLVGNLGLRVFLDFVKVDQQVCAAAAAQEKLGK